MSNIKDAIIEIVKERQGVQEDTLFNLVISKVGTTTDPINGKLYHQVFDDLIDSQIIVKKEMVYNDSKKREGYFFQQ